MSHNIEYYDYSENKSQNAIYSSLNSYVKQRTIREGGHSLEPIRWYNNKICSNYEEAQHFLQENDKGWYDQLAVRFRARKPGTKETKKLVDLRERYDLAVRQYQEFSNYVPAKDFKSQFVGCKNCESKINKNYIKTNKCPICGEDMRSDTIKERLKNMQSKVKKLERELSEEEKKCFEKNSEIRWLVKIEYHT